MVPKMRGLLAPSAKYEVDFDEARQECTNILTAWTNGNAAGTRAFIPDIEYRDECMAALAIYSCAEEEARQIPIEYVDHFGECGTWIYNTLRDNIGEREKNCLPFINLCLRVWMQMLIEETDIFADWSPLDFDKLLSAKSKAEGQRGKTSY